MLRVRLSEPILEELSRREILSSQAGPERWRPGEVIQFDPEAQIERCVHLLRGHSLPRRLGAFSYTNSPLPPDMSIGRYTSIASALSIMGSAHPTSWASTSPVFYNPGALKGVRQHLVRNISGGAFAPHPFAMVPPPINIGHDVWIGDQVMLKGGVQIGDGAIIAARSVVTKDVPPFAIVAGAPARLLRYRFSDEVAVALQGAAWWRYAPEAIHAFDVREPLAFAERLQEAEARGALSPFDGRPYRLADLLKISSPQT